MPSVGLGRLLGLDTTDDVVVPRVGQAKASTLQSGDDDLVVVVGGKANARPCQLGRADEEGVREIARRSRGTPRIVNRLLKRVRDYAQVRGDGVITYEIAREALRLLDVDDLGLDRTDRAMLHTMMVKFGGRPVGLDTLAATTGEDAVTIEDVIEPYLMQLGFIMRTPRGRICTQAAYDHMKIPMPVEARPKSHEGQTSLLD